MTDTTSSGSSGNSSNNNTAVDTKDTVTSAGPIRDWFDGDHRLIRHAVWCHHHAPPYDHRGLTAMR